MTRVIRTLLILPVRTVVRKLPCLDGQVDEVGAVLCLKLRQHVGNVILDGPLVAASLAGDLAIGVADGDEPEHRTFARGEFGEPGPSGRSSARCGVDERNRTRPMVQHVRAK